MLYTKQYPILYNGVNLFTLNLSLYNMDVENTMTKLPKLTSNLQKLANEKQYNISAQSKYLCIYTIKSHYPSQV